MWKPQNEGAGTGVRQDAMWACSLTPVAAVTVDNDGSVMVVPAAAETLFQDHRNFKLCLGPPHPESKTILDVDLG